MMQMQSLNIHRSFSDIYIHMLCDPSEYIYENTCCARLDHGHGCLIINHDVEYLPREV